MMSAKDAALLLAEGLEDVEYNRLGNVTLGVRLAVWLERHGYSIELR